MIRCPSCGNENKDGEVFCAFCAAILAVQAPAASSGAPPPRAPASDAVPSGAAPPAAAGSPQVPVPPSVPVPPPPAAAAEEGDKKDEKEEELDPLDQFLVKEAERKHGPSDFMIEELGHFSSNFDNLEDQLEDAHRAAVLKQKMAALHASDNAAPAGGDKLDQLDAILDLELEKAKQAAMEEGAPSSPPSSERGRPSPGKERAEKEGGLSDEEKLARLERYKKYLEDPSTASTGVEGGNELIRYLEAKVHQQAIEIEKLKEQKQELVREVFNDALNDPHDDTVQKLERAEKEIDKLESQVKELLEKRVVLEEKLLAKAEQVQKLLAERENIRGNLGAEFERQVQAEKEARLKAEERCAAQERELSALKEQIARQTMMMADLRAELEQTKAELERSKAEAAAASADPEELERYKRQVASLQQRVKKTMSAGATQLKALANYYEVVLNHISEIVVVFDTDENIMLVNRAARGLLGLGPRDPIGGSLKDFKALGPIIPAAERAMSTDHTLHGGETIIKAGEADKTYKLSFCPIVFPGREAFLLIMEEVRDSGRKSKRDLPPGAGLADYQLAALKEQVFSLKILAEIMSAKADQAAIVKESAEELKNEIAHIIDSLNKPESLV